jgi:hypothetical protein
VTGRCVCEDSFLAPSCAAPKPTPKPAPPAPKCAKGCGSHGRCDEVKDQCNCDGGWYGEMCEKRVCPRNCSSHGTCHADSGKCTCDSGWDGEDCTKKLCPKDCSGRGFCLHGYCFCRAPWSGPACDSMSCPDNCNNMGVCRAGVCACLNGYSGRGCTVAPCPGWQGGKVCSGHGVCFNTKCTCSGTHEPPFQEQIAWVGEACSQPTCVTGKNNMVCSGHGTCGDRGGCKCAPGWRGAGCHIRTCLHKCMGRGVCKEPGNAAPFCECRRGYMGDYCQFRSCDYDPVALVELPGCHEADGHGICRNGTCFCHGNFSGAFCDKPSCKDCTDLDKCPNKCSNAGSCEISGSQAQCRCNAGRSGADCSVVTVAPIGSGAVADATATTTPPASSEASPFVVVTLAPTTTAAPNATDALNVTRFKSTGHRAAAGPGSMVYTGKVATAAGRVAAAQAGAGKQVRQAAKEAKPVDCVSACNSRCETEALGAKDNSNGGSASCVWKCLNKCSSQDAAADGFDVAPMDVKVAGAEDIAPAILLSKN